MTSPSTRTTRALSLIEKTILGFIAGAAAAIGVVTLVLLVQRVVGLAAQETIDVAGVILTDPTFAGVPGATGAIDSVTLAVDGLNAASRGWLIAASIMAALVTVAVCAAVAWLCVRVFLGRPFVRSATWAIGVVAIMVMVGGVGASLFTGIAHAEVALFLDTDALPAFLVEVDLAPFGWGIALAVVAGAFEIGQRMQRDTEGLV